MNLDRELRRQAVRDAVHEWWPVVVWVLAVAATGVALGCSPLWVAIREAVS
jgi:hypothetical protein